MQKVLISLSDQGKTSMLISVSRPGAKLGFSFRRGEQSR
jgi:hypothetical protein